jgi:hypothetical protein
MHLFHLYPSGSQANICHNHIINKLRPHLFLFSSLYFVSQVRLIILCLLLVPSETSLQPVYSYGGVTTVLATLQYTGKVTVLATLQYWQCHSTGNIIVLATSQY